MRANQRITLLLVTTFLVWASTYAAEDTDEGDAIRQDLATKPFHAAFERLKSLEGTWAEAPWSEEGGGRRVIEYRLTGKGSTLIEEYEGDPPMTTVYHLDGDDLRMTHYCNAGNQPRMKAAWYRDNSIQFDFVDVTNLSESHAYHTRTLRVEFLDDDHVDLHFIGLKNGTDVPGTVSLTRRKKSF
jgi:hypothetical protein